MSIIWSESFSETLKGTAAFQLDKKRSVAAMCCCIGLCMSKCQKSCAQVCCSYDSDWSNLTVNQYGSPHYYIRQNANVAGTPNFSIIDKQTEKPEFTVALDSCCFNAYNCTDVVYDVNDADGNIVATITKFWGGGLPACKGF